MTRPEFATLLELLRFRATNQPDEVFYTFLVDGETNEQTLTAGELDRQARAIAAALQATVEPGQRALLIYPSGLEYIAAFFGCLYAGVIAVPAYPPRLQQKLHDRNLQRILRIVEDSRATVALTEGRTLARLGDFVELDAFFFQSLLDAVEDFIENTGG